MIQTQYRTTHTPSTIRLSIPFGIRAAYKLYKAARSYIHVAYCKLHTTILFRLNGVKFSGDFISFGMPIINVNLKGHLRIGSRFAMHSGNRYNQIGRQQPSYFIVGENAKLQIGNNVGISCTAFFCEKEIVVKDNVRIGGNCVIYDTDFHSLNTDKRIAEKEDKKDGSIGRAPVIIEENVFIGAHSLILKGVTIGKNSIVGAGSTVAKNIPANQVWAGNPAKFIRNL